MKYVIKLSIIFSLAFISCKQEDDIDFSKEHNVRIVEWNKSPDGIISDLVDTTYYIPIETHKDGLFGRINRLYLTGDRIYLFDMMNQMRVLAFDREGKFLFVVGKQGGGPQEYTRVENFTVDENNIYLFDNVNEKVIVYDKNNKFIKRVSCPFEVADLAKTKNGFFLALNYFYNDGTLNGKPKLLVVDKNFKDAKDVFLIDNDYSILHKASDLSVNEDKILYNVFGMDDIIVFDKNDISDYKTYHFEFGNRKVPLENRFDTDAYVSSKSDFIRVAFVSDKYLIGAVGASETFILNTDNGEMYRNFDIETDVNSEPVLPDGRTMEQYMSPVISAVYQNDVITYISGKYY